MATNANWTIVFEDKLIIKQSGDAAGTSYNISDDSFWSDPKFSNVWAIQYVDSTNSNEVEYRDATPHSSFVDANIGDISQFSSKWDSVHLAELQSAWDNSTLPDAEKIPKLGVRPTSYSS